MRVQPFLSLVRRELRSLANSPLAYIAVLLFLLAPAVWLFYIHRFLLADLAHLRSYFHAFPVIAVVVVPALTMRSWAEERRTGTDELLLSLPLGETALVAAKYTALLILLAMMLALTLPLPLTLLPLGDFEIGGIIGQYIGLLLLMSSAAAIGLLLSIASGSQTAAFLLSAAVLLLLMLLPAAAVRAGVPLPVIEALRSISLWSRFQSFAKGVVDTRDVCYYLLLSAGATLAGGHILVLRSWR